MWKMPLERIVIYEKKSLANDTPSATLDPYETNRTSHAGTTKPMRIKIPYNSPIYPILLIQWSTYY